MKRCRRSVFEWSGLWLRACGNWQRGVSFLMWLLISLRGRFTTHAQTADLQCNIFCLLGLHLEVLCEELEAERCKRKKKQTLDPLLRQASPSAPCSFLTICHFIWIHPPVHPVGRWTSVRWTRPVALVPQHDMQCVPMPHQGCGSSFKIHMRRLSHGSRQG